MCVGPSVFLLIEVIAGPDVFRLILEIEQMRQRLEEGEKKRKKRESIETEDDSRKKRQENRNEDKNWENVQIKTVAVVVHLIKQ